MTQLLVTLMNFLWPLLKGVFSKTALLRNQNGWNTQESEDRAKKISKEEVLQKVGKKAEEPTSLTWPTKRVPIVVTSNFGWRILKPNGVEKRVWHAGVDFRSFDNPDIIACEDAVVKKVVVPDTQYPVRFQRVNGVWKEIAPKDRAWTPYLVLIGKKSNNMYVYRHVSVIPSLKPGDSVTCGQVLGRTGNLGYSMGEHLHFEVYDFDERNQTWKSPEDPLKFFKKAGLKQEIEHQVSVPESFFLED
jgi:murein DD-endopeptidase MepM/ murein hydrolase activator NlpD